MGGEASRRSSPQLLASRIDRLPRIWRLLAGGIAGGFAGGFVAGLAARGAMRLIGMAAGEEAQGTAPTGEVVGRFTLMGFIILAIFRPAWSDAIAAVPEKAARTHGGSWPRASTS